MQKKFKLAFIGAGSIGFTRGLLADVLAVPEFSQIEIAFMDINQANLDMVAQLCQRDIDANGLDIRIQTTLDRREALKGAKYIIDCHLCLPVRGVGQHMMPIYVTDCINAGYIGTAHGIR